VAVQKSRLLVEISVECENCGHEFWYDAPVGTPDKQTVYRSTATGDVIYREYSGNGALPADEHLPTKACPKCGYYQSWMSHQVAQKEMGQRLAVPIIVSIVIFACAFIPAAIATWFMWATQVDAPKLYDASQLITGVSCFLAILALVIPAAYIQLTAPPPKARLTRTGKVNRPKKNYKVRGR
jgi:hypothetical protein